MDFVEFSSLAIGIILQNVQKLGCSERCHIHRKRVEKYLKDAVLDHDLIFLDPPYNKALVRPTLQALSINSSLKNGALIIVEHSPREAIPEEFQPHIQRQKLGKTTAFSILSLA